MPSLRNGYFRLEKIFFLKKQFPVYLNMEFHDLKYGNSINFNYFIILIKKIVWNIIVFVCMLFNKKAWRRNNIFINIKIQAKFVPFKEKFLHWHLNAYFNNRAFSFCHLQIKSWIQIMNKYWRIKIKEKKNSRWRSSWCF